MTKEIRVINEDKKISVETSKMDIYEIIATLGIAFYGVVQKAGKDPMECLQALIDTRRKLSLDD